MRADPLSSTGAFDDAEQQPDPAAPSHVAYVDQQVTQPEGTDAALLSVRDLVIEFPQHGYTVTAVDQVSFDLQRGQRLGIVGESGSGKSTLAFSVLGLLEAPARVARGVIRFGSLDLLRAPDAQIRRIRGGQIAMIFQDALGSLNPVLTIERQLREAIQLHLPISPAQATARAISLLREVGIPNPETRIQQFPHEFSGGMRQRVMIAMALAADPKLLIADEPTTALDVTTQAEVIELLLRLSEERGLAVMLITHDLGLIAGFAHDVLVMYAGAPVEYGAVDQIYYRPRHPYTRSLIAAVPQVTSSRLQRLATIPGWLPEPGTALEGCRFQPRCYLSHGRLPCLQQRPPFDSTNPALRSACHFPDEVLLEDLPMESPGIEPAAVRDALQPAKGDPAMATLLSAEGLVKTFSSGYGLIRRKKATAAVAGVSFAIPRGESFGLVGESGSGKTTVTRLLLGLTEPDAGVVVFEGAAKHGRRQAGDRARRGRMQVVFQDPADA
ncbi:MAG TPA: ABC transporter ATP-binding protein, partial [Chloroflexota bacterium]|nr:ABC transporter ATP-binding protein [Chloroflexota bacterium]